jgi:hypothetical protein
VADDVWYHGRFNRKVEVGLLLANAPFKPEEPVSQALDTCSQNTNQKKAEHVRKEKLTMMRID